MLVANIQKGQFTNVCAIYKLYFDTLGLQRELSNRGYKLPKSTKKDGSLDGILGDESKDALLDYQIKNKTK